MGRGFDTTHWSVVLAARDGDGSRARAALDALCAAYWQPLYAFVRRQGHGADEAADLTQAYFLRFLEKAYLDDVARERGRFRAFLLASMRHFLANEWDRKKAQRRAGDLAALSLDFLVAERNFNAEAVGERSPEAEYERRWALAVLARALVALERAEREAGREAQFAHLRVFLTESSETPYAEIGAALGTSESAVKIAVHRLRRKFGDKLRAEVASTVEDAAEVDDELKHLLRSLG
ncbi:MAG: RNA polymerase sigma factor [Myxococcota bacterium]